MHDLERRLMATVIQAISTIVTGLVVAVAVVFLNRRLAAIDRKAAAIGDKVDGTQSAMLAEMARLRFQVTSIGGDPTDSAAPTGESGEVSQLRTQVRDLGGDPTESNGG